MTPDKEEALRESFKGFDELYGFPHYGMDGQKISTVDWMILMEDDGARRVDLTILWPGIRISTVLLGLDHRFEGSGRPIIFETMAFSGSLDEEDGERYYTKEDAQEGHRRMVRKWKWLRWRLILKWVWKQLRRKR